MKPKRWLPWLLMAGLVFCVVMLVPRHAGHQSPTERARDIASGVRCPTCGGESALESQAPISKAIRAEIDRRVAAGESDSQIRSYLVSRYGQSILLKPSTGGVTALVWILPVVVLIVAVVVLGRAVRRWRVRAETTAASSDDEVMVVRAVTEIANRPIRQRPRSNTLRGLEEQQTYLFASLARLDRERAAGDLDETTYLALREDTTSRAAALLRQIEEAGSARPRSQSQSPPRRRRLHALAVGAALLAGAGVLVAATAHSQHARPTASGAIGATSGDPLGQARRLAQQGKIVEALKSYDQILASDPRQSEALAYRGALLAMAGQTDLGLASIERAIAADPTYPVAHYLRGLVLTQQGDQTTAAAEFRTTLADNPAPDITTAARDALDHLAAKPSIP
jgi:cytochrome c-type biogenesis protein CcmH